MIRPETKRQYNIHTSKTSKAFWSSRDTNKTSEIHSGGWYFRMVSLATSNQSSFDEKINPVFVITDLTLKVLSKNLIGSESLSFTPLSLFSTKIWDKLESSSLCSFSTSSSKLSTHRSKVSLRFLFLRSKRHFSGSNDFSTAPRQRRPDSLVRKENKRLFKSFSGSRKQLISVGIIPPRPLLLSLTR